MKKLSFLIVTLTLIKNKNFVSSWWLWILQVKQAAYHLDL